MEGSTPASERVREAYDALPGSEQAVDYGVLPPLQYATLTPTKDLSIEVIIRTPDGTRVMFEEAAEYELNEDGEVEGYVFADARDLWAALGRTVNARLNL